MRMAIPYCTSGDLGMSALLDAIGSWLTSEGVAGGSTGWTIHKLAALDAPDQTITIYQTGGPAPEQATDRKVADPDLPDRGTGQGAGGR